MQVTTFDEFLSLKISATSKLLALFLVTRPPKVFTHQDAGTALNVHAADIETAALQLLRPDDTPLHPMCVGHAAAFEMPVDHPLREAFLDIDLPELPAAAELAGGEAEAGAEDTTLVPDGSALPSGSPAAKPKRGGRGGR